MRCLSSHLRVCEPWGLFLPTPGLVLGMMACWEVPCYWFTGKYFGSLYSSRQLHMMKLLMANSLSCSMQHWNGQDTLPTALYIWTQAELVRGNMRHKYREYTDCLDVLTQHQVTLSLLSYMCLVRCTLYHNLTQLRNIQVHWCPWDAPELQY